jgi:hypothetical protein
MRRSRKEGSEFSEEGKLKVGQLSVDSIGKSEMKKPLQTSQHSHGM